jgi:hypothetical protein
LNKKKKRKKKAKKMLSSDSEQLPHSLQTIAPPLVKDNDLVVAEAKLTKSQQDKQRYKNLSPEQKRARVLKRKKLRMTKRGTMAGPSNDATFGNERQDEIDEKYANYCASRAAANYKYNSKRILTPEQKLKHSTEEKIRYQNSSAEAKQLRVQQRKENRLIRRIEEAEDEITAHERAEQRAIWETAQYNKIRGLYDQIGQLYRAHDNNLRTIFGKHYDHRKSLFQRRIYPLGTEPQSPEYLQQKAARRQLCINLSTKAREEDERFEQEKGVIYKEIEKLKKLKFGQNLDNL